MSKLHPAVSLSAWGVLALSLQRIDLPWLLALSLPIGLLAVLVSAPASYRMIKRARWLLLSIAVVFLVATPGVRLQGAPGVAGLTVEGLVLATEHTLRLTMLLASLSALLEMLGRDGLLSGLHSLLAPLGGYRESLVTRLMLTLAFADRQHAKTRWRDCLVLAPDSRLETISLATQPLSQLDRLCLALLLLFAIGIVLS